MNSPSLSTQQQDALCAAIPILSIPGRKCRLTHEDVVRDEHGDPFFPRGTLNILPLCYNHDQIPVTCTHIPFSTGKVPIFAAAEVVDSLLGTSFRDSFDFTWRQLADLDTRYRIARIGTRFLGSSIPAFVPHQTLAETQASRLHAESDAVQDRLEQLRIDLLSAIQGILNA